jgi:DNA-binding transcriptional MerR regulator
MAEPETSASQGGEGRRTYTLSDVAKKTGISMPTLQRYKKLYQSRIPSVGQGRKQRYPDEALAVFEALKVENAARRGRPRKDPSAPRPARTATRRRRAGAARRGRPPGRPARRGRPPGRPPGRPRRGRPPGRTTARRRGRPPGRGRGAGTGNLLTLTSVSERTGISYPTLVRYVKLYSSRLPHVGTGRARRFRPEAVEVFRELRQQSGRGGRRRGAGRPAGGGRRRGRPPGSASGVAARLRAVEKSQAALEKRMKRFVSSVSKLFK